MLKSIAISLILLAGAGQVMSQNCMGLYPLNEGAVSEMTTYNKKGKMIMVAIHEVKEVMQNGADTEYSIYTKILDDKGEVSTEGTSSAVCRDGKFTMNIENVLDQDTQANLRDMEFEFTGDEIIIPSDIQVGQTLPDASMVMQTTGPVKLKATLSITNRKVEKKEEVTVPAGTYDCFVITSDQVLKMMVNSENTLKKWISPEAGLVKLEVYNKKGKMTSSQELTKYSD